MEFVRDDVDGEAAIVPPVGPPRELRGVRIPMASRSDRCVRARRSFMYDRWLRLLSLRLVRGVRLLTRPLRGVRPHDASLDDARMGKSMDGGLRPRRVETAGPPSPLKRSPRALRLVRGVRPPTEAASDEAPLPPRW